MGNTMRRTAGTADADHSTTTTPGRSDAGPASAAADSVEELESPAEKHQRLAFEKAEAANARLKEKRNQQQQGSKKASPSNKSSTSQDAEEEDGDDAKAAASKRSRKEREREREREHKKRSEPKWNKPVQSAEVVAAALHTHSGDDADEDMEVETIALENQSFAAKTTTAATGGPSSGQQRSASNSRDLTSGPPSSGGAPSTGLLVNPWSKPQGSALFTRNFQSESADAELFVQIARDRAKAESKKQKKKSSIIQSHQSSGGGGGGGAASQTAKSTPSDDEEPTDKEFDDEF